MRNRTPILLVLLACAAALFVASFLTADRIPSAGNARLEALTSALATAGATVLGGVVTLTAVVWALNLEGRRAVQERYRGHQADLIRDAADWSRAGAREVGHILAAVFEANQVANGPNPRLRRRRLAQAHATRRL